MDKAGGASSGVDAVCDDFSNDYYDRSLPMSRWMRRNERIDFMDMCASPPADGFFHADQPKVNSTSAVSGAYGPQKRENFAVTSVDGGDDENRCSNSKEKSRFFKSFSYYPANMMSSSGDSKAQKVLNMDSNELEDWAKKNIRSNEMSVDSYSHDAASSAVDHAHQHKRLVPAVVKTRDDSLDHLGVTPDVTPSVTPAVSPQVCRRAGNPFFTGDPNQKQEGNWLFRPGPKNQDSVMYEAILDIKPSTQNQQSTKSVRYVPRPSQRRELNFFSPTSM